MIIFSGTKTVGDKKFIIFSNDKGSTVDIPIDEKFELVFTHHIDRLSTSKIEEASP